MHDRCPLPPLSWPSHAYHQLSSAGDLWEIRSAFASRKDLTDSLREGKETRLGEVKQWRENSRVLDYLLTSKAKGLAQP